MTFIVFVATPEEPGHRLPELAIKQNEEERLQELELVENVDKNPNLDVQNVPAGLHNGLVFLKEKKESATILLGMTTLTSYWAFKSHPKRMTPGKKVQS